MFMEAYVRNKVNDYTMDCVVALNKYYTVEKRILLYPLKKKNNKFKIDDILHRGIYIWIHPIFKMQNNYLGKIVYKDNDKIYFINQAFEEIIKKIE